MYKNLYPENLVIGQQLATVLYIRIQFFDFDINEVNQLTSEIIVGNLYVDVNSFDFQAFGCISITAQLEAYISKELGVKSQIMWSEVDMQIASDCRYDLYITLNTNDLKNLSPQFTDE